jgi:hypothetical protein
MGLLQDGIECCPAESPTQHVCCICEACVLVLSFEECAALCGVDHPEWHTCDGIPCFVLCEYRACCVDNECFLVVECACDQLQGEWFPELEDCGPPNPCEIVTPVKPSTWGAVKALFR